jgi:hypothetical protein
VYRAGPKLDRGNYLVGVSVRPFTCVGAWRQSADQSTRSLKTGHFDPSVQSLLIRSSYVVLDIRLPVAFCLDYK